MAELILLHLNEPDGIAPSDDAGNLDDLRTEPGITAPTSVATFTGNGRRFLRASSQALLAPDLDGGDTLATKDVTIQALISLTLTGASGPHTVIARGLNDGSISERYAYGLELEEQAANPGQVEIRLFWQDSAGTIRTAPPGVYTHPGDGKEILITATRRWETTSKVVVRYYVNDDLIGELETTYGDISGGTTGRTTFGARKAAGSWDRFLNGTIDEFVVLGLELSHEEIRQTWKRLTEHQPGGVETLVDLSPPGLGWGRDPDSYDGRRFRIAGQALGLATSFVEALRELWLPDRASLEQIARWERLCGLSPKPRDSLDVRRIRVVSYLAREEGLSRPAMRQAFAEILDAGADDLEILESTNELVDGFSTLSGRWLAGSAGTWSIVANQAHLAYAGGSDISLQAADLPAHLRTSIDHGNAGADGDRVYLAAKLAAWSIAAPTAPATEAGVGIYLHNRITGDLAWLGVFRDAGGTNRIGYRLRVDGVLGAFTVLAAAPGAGPLWLRMETDPNPAAGGLNVSWSTTGPNAGFTTTFVSTIFSERLVHWAGFLAWSDVSGNAGAITADFDDLVAFTPGGSLPFYWYVFRDPLLGGSPDRNGARELAKKIKPAHTWAAPIESKALIAGDPLYGLAGLGPAGDGT